ncbi:uncharacterized protein LOC111329132 [Stylophora pistillata]|uniref:Uncharacterized protein n=1 Tax=Stylophora pistillata TaxID=50429 RepID=A0A2B4S6N9_STYPI|nr:uncharacterized protein LOC111329132 [Stylophora pistillata]PFX26334.1 hypothetical protein AWC38_SpisGene9022 [Stylophora pistillata]
MLPLHRGTRISFYLFLLTIHADFAHKLSALLEGHDITDKENKTKTEHLSNHGLKYQRIPHGFSSFSDCLSKQGMVFLGGPCGVMPATSCGGFNCASGIGFPISPVCCSLVDCRKTNQPSREIDTIKRFDITSLPAHPFALSSKTPVKPFKGKRMRKHKHPKPKKYDHQSTEEGPNIDVKLKLNDEPKSKAQDEAPAFHPQVVLGQPLHLRPWFPYLHRPIYPFDMQYHSHFSPHCLHHPMRFQHPSYWTFQGYFPHFMGMRSPWAMNPSDMSNVHHYPEYQYSDMHFVQSNHPSRYSRPPFRDFNDFSSDLKLLEKPERLHDLWTHSKNKIKSPNEYDGVHEEDRKMVNNSEDLRETVKWGNYQQWGTEHEIEPSSIVTEDQGMLHFDPSEKEDVDTNYPEYKSEFNTERVSRPSVESRRGKLNRHLKFHKSLKKGNGSLRGFNSANQGFHLDVISTFQMKGKQKRKERQKADLLSPKESSVVGAIGLKLDPVIIANAIHANA